MAKQKGTFRLTDTAINYINEYAEKNAVTKTESLERILREHKNQSQSEVDVIADAVIEKMDEKYKNLFTRLRLATNFTDKNVQIALEVLNSLAVSLDTKLFVTSAVKSPVLEGSEKAVTKRIAEYKQSVDSKKVKNDKKEGK